jgi:sec-independent protein translocase protein TatB
MFGIGFLEMVVVAVVALIFFGPDKLPEIMKQAGKYFVQLRRMSNEVKSAVDVAIRNAERELDKEAREKVKPVEILTASVTTKDDSLPSEQASEEQPHDEHGRLKVD